MSVLARELLLERRELCERRIRIGGAVVARVGARRILPVRGTGLAVAASATLVAITAAAIAAALELVAALVTALVLGTVAALAAVLALVVTTAFTPLLTA